MDDKPYEWNRLAFVLTNARGKFHRLMNSVLRCVTGKICLVYLGDIIIFYRSIEDHISNLKTVFSKDLLEEANLNLQNVIS